MQNKKNFNSSRKGILLPPRQHLGLLYGEDHEISRRKVFTGMVGSFRKQLMIDLYVASLVLRWSLLALKCLITILGPMRGVGRQNKRI